MSGRSLTGLVDANIAADQAKLVALSPGLLSKPPPIIEYIPSSGLNIRFCLSADGAEKPANIAPQHALVNSREVDGSDGTPRPPNVTADERGKRERYADEAYREFFPCDHIPTLP